MRACGGCGDWVGDAAAPPPTPNAPIAPPRPAWAPEVPPNWDPMAGGYVTVRPKKRVWPKVVGGLVVLIVLILGIGVAVAIFGDHAPPALDDYMHGKGVSYRSTDRQVIVRMPKTPEIQPPRASRSKA